MAHKILYSTANKPIYSANNRPVYGDVFMPMFEMNVTRTDYDNKDATEWVRSCLVFGPENLIGDDYGSLLIDKYVFALGTYAWGYNRDYQKSVMLDFRSENSATGWGWHGTHWQFDFYGWCYYAGNSADYEFRVNGNTLNISYAFPQVASGDPINTAAIKVCTVRYTPSTNVLEYV